MRSKLHSYLLERPSGASPRELLDLIFTQPGADEEFGPRFLRTLLGSDTRFAFCEEAGRWVATAHAALARRLDQTPFVVVDVETTGGSPARGDGIIEIGAVRLACGHVVEHFEQLVNPGRPLPSFITRLTGITDAMLADQPSIETTVQRFLDFARDAVLIAHNARFDLSFLNAALYTACGRTIDQPHLCTLRLARRLLPQVRRRSLDSLAGHLGIPLVDRHRALGDANITAEVFFHLLEQLAQRGITRLDQALDFQYQAADGRRFVCLLPRERIDQLPQAPGIYRFTGADGRLLYIGKAANLRQRVASYRSSAAGHSRKTLDLIRNIREVCVQQTGSELEASLLEAEEIRRCQPPYNTLRKHLPRIAFLVLNVADPFPRLSVTARLGRGTSRYFGPFRSRAAAQRALDLLVRLFRLRTCSGRLRPEPGVAPCFQAQIGACTMPCAARVGAAKYAEQVVAALRFFDGEIDAARAQLEGKRDEHSAALRFEAAQRTQRDLELLAELSRRQQSLGWVVARQHFVIIQPTVDGSRSLLYAIVRGRLVERCNVRGYADLLSLSGRLRSLLEGTPMRPLQPEDVDGTTILAAWLRARGEHDGYVFPLGDATQLEAQLPEWAAALNTFVTGGEPVPTP